MGKRKYHFRINLRMKLIYISIIFLFLCVFLIMRYTFKNSRDILINQEAGIIAQYMDRNEMALENLTDSMRSFQHQQAGFIRLRTCRRMWNLLF